MSYAVLVIEDEATLAKNISTFLTNAGFEVRASGTAEEALRELESFKPDAMLLDFNLHGMNGLQAIGRIRAIDAHVKIIMLTGHAAVDLAVEAMKSGACDFITKPISLAELRTLLDKLRSEERQAEALAYYVARDASRSGLDKLIGTCEAMQRLRQSIDRVIAGDEKLRDDDAPAVLITGETGTGKELVARALHFDGPRRDAPFVEINCAAIPAQLLESELFGHERGAFTDAKSRKLGLVEAADGGTLFLDEIGDMDLALQSKLLRLLEDKTVRRIGSVRDQNVSVRIVAATHRPLEKLVAEGRFRADLFFRIRIVHLAIPALRDRGADVMMLAQYFLALHAQRYDKATLRLSADARQSLVRHRWPGNVRELRNVIEQAVLMTSGPLAESVNLGWLPTAGAETGTSDDDATVATLNLETLERDTLRRALEAAKWNVSQAAKLLGVSRDTLRYRIEKFGLSTRQ